MALIEECWAYNKGVGRCPNPVVSNHYCEEHLRPCLSIYFNYKHLQLLADAINIPAKVNKMLIPQLMNKLFYMRSEVAFRIAFTRQCVPPEFRDEGHEKYLKERLAEIERLETMYDKTQPKPVQHSYSVLGIEQGKVEIDEDFTNKLTVFNVPPPTIKKEDLDFDSVLKNWQAIELANLKTIVDDYTNKLWDIFMGPWMKDYLPASVMNLVLIRGDLPISEALHQVGITELQMVEGSLDKGDLLSLLETVILRYGQTMIDNLPLLVKQAASDQPIYRSNSVGLLVKYFETMKYAEPLATEKKPDTHVVGWAYKQIKATYALALPYFRLMVGNSMAPALAFRSTMLLPLMCGPRWTHSSAILWFKSGYQNDRVETTVSAVERNPKLTDKQSEAAIDGLLSSPNISYQWYIAMRDNNALFNFITEDAKPLLAVAKSACDYMYLSDGYDPIRTMIVEGLTNKVYKLCLINIIGKPENKGAEFMVALNKYIVHVQPTHYGKGSNKLTSRTREVDITLTFSNKDLARDLVMSILDIFQPTAINDLLDELIANKTKLI